MKFATKLILFAAAVVIIVLAFAFFPSANSTKYDSFAQCLNGKGMKIYVASWCPHCHDQEAMFGSSFSKLSSVVCSTDPSQETQECQSLGIQSYPTWKFPNGAMQPGVLSLEQLSAISGCPLP